MRYVFITGVSTGIGLATTKLLIRHQFIVIGTVRQSSQGDKLRADLGPAFYPVIADVKDEISIERAAKTVSEVIGDAPLAGVINNAGIAVTGPLTRIKIDEISDQLEVNVLGPLRVVQHMMPFLRRSKPGRIINVSSVSGRITLPFTGAYSASKFALEAISDALRRELRIFGIKVIVIQPGPIRTPMWDKALGSGERYQDTEFAALIQKREERSTAMLKQAKEPEAVAKCILKALTRRRVRTRYVVIHNKWRMYTIPQLLPDKWLDLVVARMLKS